MANARVERRLAAILAADVVGYSRLMGADEEGTLAALKSHQRELFDPKIAEHRGRIVKTTGDGALVEFASAVDAVRCAVDIQRAMAQRGVSVSDDRRITFRIGINVGDVITDEGDLFGDGVNIAARIEAIAEPGGVSMSEDAYRQIEGKIDAAFEYAGQQQLKNIAKPIRIYRLRLDADAQPPALALPDKPSIAVLPFDNMSDDPDQEYFADGMAEDIITALSRCAWLFVIARNSSFTYKGRAVDIRQVGRELGVRYVLEGSVRRGGNRVRFTAQLIEATSGTHIWADRIDGELSDIFALQDHITEKVIGSIEPNLQLAEIARLKHKHTPNLDAYDLLLRAQQLEYEFTEQSLTAAIECLEPGAEDRSFICPCHGARGLLLCRAALSGLGQGFRSRGRGRPATGRPRAGAWEATTATSCGWWRSQPGISTPDTQRAKELAYQSLQINPNSAVALGHGGLARGHLRQRRQGVWSCFNAPTG